MNGTSPIVALVGERRDPVSGRATRSRNDALAAALALQLAPPAGVRLLHAGGMGEAVARDYLALGARSIELLAPGADLVATLVEALRPAALVLTGSRAMDGYGSGALPFVLAAALGRPLLTRVVAVEAEGRGWRVTQALPKGARRRLRLTVPALLAVSPGAPLTLRHAYADRVTGEILRPRAPSVLPPQALEATPCTRVPAAKRLKPLEAPVARSGHARMQAAVGSTASAGGTVIATGSPEDKARAVLQYLRAHALVNV